MTATEVTLAVGGLSLELAPEVGGSVAAFRWHRGQEVIDLMRPLSSQARARRDACAAAMFPMVPYANRIAGNSFEFEERTYRFSPNLPGEPLNMHGSGWQSSWTVAHRSATSAILVLDHSNALDGYVFSAIQYFELTPRGFTVTLEVANRGPRAMPFGFGHHPYWPRDAEVTLRFRSTHFWLEGLDCVATDRITLPPELDFSAGRTLPRARRNNGYAGWDGFAEIELTAQSVGLRMQADAVFSHLMFYCDPTQSIFCLEPQTHAVGAFNRLSENSALDLGARILEPGQALRGSLSFTPYEVAAVRS